MPAPRENIEVELGSVGELNQEYPVRGDRGDRGDGKTGRQGMEAVQNDSDRGVVGSPDDFPGIPVIVDIASPRQRLEADAQAARVRPLSQFAKVVGGPVDAAERDRRDIAANQQEIGAELLHQVELPFRPAKGLLALRLGHPLEIAEWLQGADAQAEIPAHPRDVAGGAVKAGKVVLEYFDRVETGRRDGLELLVESATDRDCCDRTYHFTAPLSFDKPAASRVINNEFARPCAIRPTCACRSRRTRDRPESARTACRCRPDSRSPWRAPTARKGVISSFITTSPTNVVGEIRSTFSGSGSSFFMPSGVALTTMSYPPGSAEPDAYLEFRIMGLEPLRQPVHGLRERVVQAEPGRRRPSPARRRSRNRLRRSPRRGRSRPRACGPFSHTAHKPFAVEHVADHGAAFVDPYRVAGSCDLRRNGGLVDELEGRDLVGHGDERAMYIGKPEDQFQEQGVILALAAHRHHDRVDLSRLEERVVDHRRLERFRRIADVGDELCFSVNHRFKPVCRALGSRSCVQCTLVQTRIEPQRRRDSSCREPW